jgi:hypothetical protein
MESRNSQVGDSVRCGGTQIGPMCACAKAVYLDGKRQRNFMALSLPVLACVLVVAVAASVAEATATATTSMTARNVMARVTTVGGLRFVQ